jgi:hypothetical protein
MVQSSSNLFELKLFCKNVKINLLVRRVLCKNLSFRSGVIMAIHQILINEN